MSPQASRSLLGLLLAGGIGACWWGLRYVKNFRAPSPFAPPRPPLLPADVGLRLSEVSIIGRSEGKRRWILKAGQVEGSRSRDRLNLRQRVEVVALAADGKTMQARIKAPEALYETRSKRLLAEAGAVATVLERGQVKALLRAPRTSYGLAEKRLRATGGIHATLHESGRPRATLVAPALDYAVDRKVLQATGGFMATLLPLAPGDRRATLSGPSASWSEAAQVLDCPDGATLTRGTLLATVASLRADLKKGAYSTGEGSGSSHIDELKEFTP